MPNGGTHEEMANFEAHLGAEKPTEDSLKRLSSLAEEFKLRKAELFEANEAAKAAKKEFNKYSQSLIPEAMMEVNMSSFSLSSGETITYKEEVSVSVKDYDAFYNFLNERGDGSLIKIKLEVGKVPKEILANMVKTLYDKFGILAETSLYCHPMTLKSYISGICGFKKGQVAELSLADIDENMLDTFTYYKTTVK